MKNLARLLVKLSDALASTTVSNRQLQELYPDAQIVDDIRGISVNKQGRKLVSNKLTITLLRQAAVELVDLQNDNDRMRNELDICAKLLQIHIDYRNLPLYKKLFISFDKYSAKRLANDT